ncbi:hypothetical protein PR048_026927 [Dryococelus australis]|uniref:Uncharacterized protein n=1 Tax=Dryococelus australis TaxID=614101 RepID=A0ABQ9GMQ2_9NEOP|nr:hypothetical protein PR048_026927 [Dryococelus australis]
MKQLFSVRRSRGPYIAMRHVAIKRFRWRAIRVRVPCSHFGLAMYVAARLGTGVVVRYCSALVPQARQLLVGRYKMAGGSRHCYHYRAGSLPNSGPALGEHAGRCYSRQCSQTQHDIHECIHDRSNPSGWFYHVNQAAVEYVSLPDAPGKQCRHSHKAARGRQSTRVALPSCSLQGRHHASHSSPGPPSTHYKFFNDHQSQPPPMTRDYYHFAQKLLKSSTPEACSTTLHTSAVDPPGSTRPGAINSTNHSVGPSIPVRYLYVNTPLRSVHPGVQKGRAPTTTNTSIRRRTATSGCIADRSTEGTGRGICLGRECPTVAGTHPDSSRKTAHTTYCSMFLHQVSTPIYFPSHTRPGTDPHPAVSALATGNDTKLGIVNSFFGNSAPATWGQRYLASPYGTSATSTTHATADLLLRPNPGDRDTESIRAQADDWLKNVEESAACGSGFTRWPVCSRHVTRGGGRLSLCRLTPGLELFAHAVVDTLAIAGELNSVELYPGDEDCVVLRVLPRTVEPQQCAKIVVLYYTLEALAERPPLLPKPTTLHLKPYVEHSFQPRNACEAMWFQQNRTLLHFATVIRQHLDMHFLKRWIGRGGPIAWPPYSPDITPPDFWLWRHIKSMAYATSLDTSNELITPETFAHTSAMHCLYGSRLGSLEIAFFQLVDLQVWELLSEILVDGVVVGRQPQQLGVKAGMDRSSYWLKVQGFGSYLSLDVLLGQLTPEIVGASKLQSSWKRGSFGMLAGSVALRRVELSTGLRQAVPTLESRWLFGQRDGQRGGCGVWRKRETKERREQLLFPLTHQAPSAGQAIPGLKASCGMYSVTALFLGEGHSCGEARRENYVVHGTYNCEARTHIEVHLRMLHGSDGPHRLHRRLQQEKSNYSLLGDCPVGSYVHPLLPYTTLSRHFLKPTSRGAVGWCAAGLQCGRFWVSIQSEFHFSFTDGGHGGSAISTLPSHHQGELGAIPGRVTKFSQVGIVPDDAVGRRVFSGISHFPRPFIPSLPSPSSALKTSLLRASQISSLILSLTSQAWTAYTSLFSSILSLSFHCCFLSSLHTQQPNFLHPHSQFNILYVLTSLYALLLPFNDFQPISFIHRELGYMDRNDAFRCFTRVEQCVHDNDDDAVAGLRVMMPMAHGCSSSPPPLKILPVLMKFPPE